MGPKQAEGLDVAEVDDGFVVYDPGQDRIHYLNHTAALVLELCNGEVEAERLPALVQAAFDLDEAPEEEIAACLEELRREGLVA